MEQRGRTRIFRAVSEHCETPRSAAIIVLGKDVQKIDTLRQRVSAWQ